MGKQRHDLGFKKRKARVELARVECVPQLDYEAHAVDLVKQGICDPSILEISSRWQIAIGPATKRRRQARLTAADGTEEAPLPTNQPED